MSQPTSSLLPPRKPRRNNPLGRMIAEALDNQLLHFAQTDTPFTIPKVRDILLTLPELADCDKTKLRYYVRDRVHTLERLGLAKRVGVEGENRTIYCLTLVEATEETAEQAATPETTPSTSPADTDDLLSFLEKDRHHLSTRMHVAISEAEYYKKVLDRYPHEKARIAPLLKTSIEQSDRLKGEWDANLTLRRQLTGKETRA
ncbi:hypothetical protein VRRI112168_07250 [Vreelandella rituensis]|uniref:Uncharacterized protein n=1 Tax=Vreelandella rituensis TaxID=2282306 RepID=A0A368U5L6_9GAMM|nr:hypothetical protein [Halomonas rituensis]RCV92171.1 hypothetical protein DU506_09220 [Halomonas rituensis]